MSLLANSKNLNNINLPFVVKSKCFYSTDIKFEVFFEDIKNFVPEVQQMKNQNGDTTGVMFSFPYLIYILDGINTKLYENPFNKLTSEQIDVLHVKCQDIVKKGLLLSQMQILFKKKPWYCHDTFYEGEKKYRFLVNENTNYEELNRYFSWSIKRYHNLIFKNFQSLMNEIEFKAGINKSYSEDNDNLFEDDVILLKEYIKNIDEDYKKGVKAPHVNARYIINLFCNDEEFKKGLTMYDSGENKKNLTKQILRYVRELILYFRFVNFYEHLIKTGKIEKAEEKFIIYNMLQKMSAPIEYYIPFLNPSKISNKSHDKIIDLLNNADIHYFNILREALINPELLLYFVDDGK